MRKLREVVRLHLEKGLGGRAIARSCCISPSTVSEYLGRIKLAKLSWPLPEELDDDAALTRLLFPDEHQPRRDRPEPDWARVYEELKRKHVTKQLLWQEYREQHPDGYQYSQFCERYARFSQQLSVPMEAGAPSRGETCVGPGAARVLPGHAVQPGARVAGSPHGSYALRIWSKFGPPRTDEPIWSRDASPAPFLRGGA